MGANPANGTRPGIGATREIAVRFSVACRWVTLCSFNFTHGQYGSRTAQRSKANRTIRS
jgi:hypothetical protein